MDEELRKRTSHVADADWVKAIGTGKCLTGSVEVGDARIGVAFEGHQLWAAIDASRFDPGRLGFDIAVIHPDGRVTLSDQITLDDVKALPLPYLRVLREIVNTAIYDKERDPCS